MIYTGYSYTPENGKEMFIKSGSKNFDIQPTIDKIKELHPKVTIYKNGEEILSNR